MSIKDILVVCDASEANDFRIHTTLLFAKYFYAHVTGIHLTPYPTPSESSSGFNKVIDYLSSEKLELAKETAENIKKNFDKKASELNISHEWSFIDGIDKQFIIDHARYADLVMLPQGYSSFAEGNPYRIDDYLSIYMGRPTIILPDMKKLFHLPKKIIIAWDESKEATRAVHDAMPFLESADNVQIMTVSDTQKQELSNIIYGDDLRKHLSHHSINAEVVMADELENGIGKTILQGALEYDADLIVMGAYGETRLKEIVLGGVTRYLLNNTTVPLFLSH